MDKLFVCPKPAVWCEILQNAFPKWLEMGDRSDHPRIPPLLSDWYFSSPIDKMEAWNKTIVWFHRNNLSKYIPEIPPEKSYFWGDDPIVASVTDPRELEFEVPAEEDVESFDFQKNLTSNVNRWIKEGRDIYPFLIRMDEIEGSYLMDLYIALEGVISKGNLSQEEIQAVKKLVLGILRLPLITPGLDVRLSMSVSGESASDSIIIEFTNEYFHLYECGFSDGGFGTDSYSGRDLFISVDRESKLFDPSGLFGTFINWLGFVPIEIEDSSNDDLLDWHIRDEDRDTFWEWLEKHRYW
jgi:hypothetical protein